MSTLKFESNPYFQEAYSGKLSEPLILGHLSDTSCYRDTKNVFYPEGNNEQWSYEKNLAWIFGGIKAGRTFLIISDINHYLSALDRKISYIQRLVSTGYSPTKKNMVSQKNHHSQKIPNIGFTFDEVRWLFDNNYQFVVDNENPTQTFAIPDQKQSSDTLVVKHYGGLVGPDANNNILKELLTIQHIFRTIEKQRCNSISPPHFSIVVSKINVTAMELDKLKEEFEIEENNSFLLASTILHW